MTDLDIYRARIGLNNLRKCGGNTNNINSKYSRNTCPLIWKIIIIFALGSFSFSMTKGQNGLRGSHLSSGLLMERNNTSHLSPGILMELNRLSNLSPSLLMEQNYQLKASEWNSYMKAMNGNKTCINVAH